MICLQKLNKNDIIICLLAFCVIMLLFNYTKIYKLNFCEMSSVEKFKIDNKLLEKFAINYEKLKVMLSSTKTFETSNLSDQTNVFRHHIGEKNSINPILNKAITHNLQLKMEISKKRDSLISIGIPTIRRNNVSYLKQTLDSLFYSMTNEEKKFVLIVVFIAEVIFIFK